MPKFVIYHMTTGSENLSISDGHQQGFHIELTEKNMYTFKTLRYGMRYRHVAKTHFTLHLFVKRQILQLV